MFGPAQSVMLAFPFERPMFMREYATGTCTFTLWLSNAMPRIVNSAFLISNLCALILYFPILDQFLILRSRYIIFLDEDDVGTSVDTGADICPIYYVLLHDRLTGANPLEVYQYLMLLSFYVPYILISLLSRATLYTSCWLLGGWDVPHAQ